MFTPLATGLVGIVDVVAGCAGAPLKFETNSIEVTAADVWLLESLCVDTPTCS